MTSPTLGDTSSEASYLIKTFGSTMNGLTFNRLPTAIIKAKKLIPDEEIIGFLLCALDLPPRMTGLMFCDDRHQFPPGLPARTPPLVRRFYRAGYLVVQAETGGLFVVAHWYFENAEIGPFYELH